MTTIAFPVPEETLVALKLTAETAPAEIRIAAAMKLYELGRLSSGAAAALAGIPRVLFLSKLADYGIGNSRSQAPKGRTKIARGEAPGDDAPLSMHALKGRLICDAAPFQGFQTCQMPHSRGFAPGCLGTPLRGSRLRCDTLGGKCEKRRPPGSTSAPLTMSSDSVDAIPPTGRVHRGAKSVERRATSDLNLHRSSLFSLRSSVNRAIRQDHMESVGGHAQR